MEKGVVKKGEEVTMLYETGKIKFFTYAEKTVSHVKKMLKIGNVIDEVLICEEPIEPSCLDSLAYTEKLKAVIYPRNGVYNIYLFYGFAFPTAWHGQNNSDGDKLPQEMIHCNVSGSFAATKEKKDAISVIRHIESLF